MTFHPRLDSTWDGDQQLDWMVQERTLSPEDTPWELGKRDLYGYFPAAVRSVAHLAMYAGAEHVRFRAAAYVIEAVTKLEDMERLGRGGPLEDMVRKMNEFANGGKNGANP